MGNKKLPPGWAKTLNLRPSLESLIEDLYDRLEKCEKHCEDCCSKKSAPAPKKKKTSFGSDE